MTDIICECGHKAVIHFIANSGCSIEGCGCKKPLLKIHAETIAAQAVTIERLKEALKEMQALAMIKYGNLDKDVWEVFERNKAFLAELETK